MMLSAYYTSAQQKISWVSSEQSWGDTLNNYERVEIIYHPEDGTVLFKHAESKEKDVWVHLSGCYSSMNFGQTQYSCQLAKSSVYTHIFFEFPRNLSDILNGDKRSLKEINLGRFDFRTGGTIVFDSYKSIKRIEPDLD